MNEDRNGMGVREGLKELILPDFKPGDVIDMGIKKMKSTVEDDAQIFNHGVGRRQSSCQ